MERKPNIFILNGSVNSKHAHPLPPPFRPLSDICHFVLEELQMPHGGAERSYKTPTVGLKNRHGKKTKHLYSLWLGQFQTCPSPRLPAFVGHCHFVLEKLQMPHGGAERSYKTPTVGLKNRVQMPHPGITPKLNFQLISCKYHIYGNSLITC